MENSLTSEPTQLLLFDLESLEVLCPSPQPSPAPAVRVQQSPPNPTRANYKYGKRLTKQMVGRLAAVTKQHLAGDGTFSTTAAKKLEQMANYLLGIRAGRRVDGLRSQPPEREVLCGEFFHTVELQAQKAVEPGSDEHVALLDLGLDSTPIPDGATQPSHEIFRRIRYQLFGDSEQLDTAQLSGNPG